MVDTLDLASAVMAGLLGCQRTEEAVTVALSLLLSARAGAACTIFAALLDLLGLASPFLERPRSTPLCTPAPFLSAQAFLTLAFHHGKLPRLCSTWAAHLNLERVLESGARAWSRARGFIALASTQLGGLACPRE